MRWLPIIVVTFTTAPAFAQDGAAKPAAKPAAAKPGGAGEAEPAKPADAFKLEHFELFERRNPFSPTPERKPATKPDPKPVTKPDPKPVKPRETRDEITKNLTLTSVMIPRSGSTDPVAIVEEDGAEPRQLRQGDAFLKGKVTAVSLDGITVLIGDTPTVIKLGEPFADGTKTHKVYADTGERVDGSDKAGASGSGGSSAGDSGSKKPGGVSSLVTEEERKSLPPAELRKLIMKRMKERREQQRKEKGK